MIDALYEGFVCSLPEALRGAALDLPRTLGLAPSGGCRWSEVFSHQVTLEAPLLVAEAFPSAPQELTRRAVLSHGLAIIDAFGTDRLADGQVQESSILVDVLERIRSARDTVLEQILPGASAQARASDDLVRGATGEEHELLRSLGAATFHEYRRISLDKQAPGFPASLAFARAAGAGEEQVENLRQALTGVWLGLQFEDDAIDWEDDWKLGHGAWAVSLARRRLESVKEQESDERPTEPDMIRRRVFNMGVLYSMLRDARGEYRNAIQHSRALGAGALASWAEERERRLDVLLPLEARHAGYVVRARKLSAWAAEVLS